MIKRFFAMIWFSMLCVISMSVLLPEPADAAEFSRNQVPDGLKTWIPWVLDEAGEAACPHWYNSNEQRLCAWPASLELKAGQKNAGFTQDWQVYQTAWIILPGDAKVWPEQVTANGKVIAVLSRNGLPALKLEPGVHHLQGSFVWDKLPESLALPDNLALLKLSVDGQIINHPVRDASNRLWLQKNTVETAQEAIQLKVFRKITDSIPLTVHSRFRLQISGKAREISIARALLSEMTAQEISSALPARIDQDGNLIVQARPGSWDISVIAYHPGLVSHLSLPKLATQKPEITDKAVGTALGTVAGTVLNTAALFDPEEIWVFEAEPLLRTTTIEGVNAVDVSQTTLPDEWRNLPAYLMNQTTQFGIKQIRRGDSDPAPNKLALERKIWLSFDGQSMTVNDRIHGTMNRPERLNLHSEGNLGRVDVSGVAQQISVDTQQRAGIELQRGPVTLTADSFIKKASTEFSAVGWQQDFDQLSVQLQLPPGWQLLYATGADKADGAWLTHWNLLDFFVVLLIALATGHLWGWRWGVLGMLMLIVTYPEIEAAHFSWLVVLALIALLRVLPAGRIQKIIGYAQKMSLLALVLICLNFATHQVRLAIYPILENSSANWTQAGSVYGVAGSQIASAPQANIKADSSNAEVAQVETRPAPPADMPPPPPEVTVAAPQVQANMRMKIYSEPLQQARVQLDPNAKIQTGPGLPQWSWHAYHLKFDGPVRQDQKVNLYLISPWMNKLLVLLQLLLIMVFLFRIAKKPDDQAGQTTDRNKSAPSNPQHQVTGNENAGVSGMGSNQMSGNQMSQFFTKIFNKINISKKSSSGKNALILPLVVSAALYLGLGYLTVHPVTVSAQMPSQEHLDALREKLTRAADCLPECAEISRMLVQVSANSLHLKLEIDAGVETAVPLPGAVKQWLPDSVSLDGKIAYLHKDNQGNLWLLLSAGRHTVDMLSSLSEIDTLQIPMLKRPKRIALLAQDWEISGVSDETGTADSLQLSRVQKTLTKASKDAAADNSALQALLQLSRELRFDKEWTVQTTLSRVSPLGVPALVSIPLLPGEAVTSAGVDVKDAAVLVNLAAQVSSISWSSRLNQSEKLTLASDKNARWFETWVITTSNNWHLETQGLAPVALDTNAANGVVNQNDLQFRPFPGESLQLKIHKPRPLAGQTVTIDQSYLNVRPGIRATDYQLRLSLRSSLGGEHRISLPEGAQLQSVLQNGQIRPLRLNFSAGSKHPEISFTVSPGVEQIEINYRLAQAMSSSFSSLPAGLGIDSVNHHLRLQLPQNRWLLMANGPGIGPAILFWGKLIILCLVAIALGRYAALPLRTYQCLLLALGLTQVSWWSAICVVLWFFAFNYRRQSQPGLAWKWFNLRQLGLIVLSFLMLSILFDAVQGGLLGQPEMQVVGNASTANILNWYVDQASAQLPTAWSFSLPILVYRGLMLLWALWLAWSLITWLKWGWAAFSSETLWKKKPLIDASSEIV